MSNLNSTSSGLAIALAATDPVLDKMVKTQATLTMLNVDVGIAFGKAIVPFHNEPLGHNAFSDLYAKPLREHIAERLGGYVSEKAAFVSLRVANLTAAGKRIPTRNAVQKKNGTKPLSDTLYLALLVEAQRAAGLAISKPGSGGDNRTPEQIAEAARKAAEKAAEAAKKAGDVVPPVVPPVAPQVKGKPAAADPVAPTIDTKKAREDAAAMIMGNPKHGDLLLQAVTSRKSALIKWLESK